MTTIEIIIEQAHELGINLSAAEARDLMWKTGLFLSRYPGCPVANSVERDVLRKRAREVLATMVKSSADTPA